MENTPIFIKVTGQTTGACVRVNINTITKYRSNNGGTGFYTYVSPDSPYMIAKESPETVDRLVKEAIDNLPDHYSLKP